MSTRTWLWVEILDDCLIDMREHLSCKFYTTLTDRNIIELWKLFYLLIILVLVLLACIWLNKCRNLLILLKNIQFSELTLIHCCSDVIVLDIVIKIVAGLPDHRHKIPIHVRLVLTIYVLVKFVSEFKLVLLAMHCKTLIDYSI